MASAQAIEREVERLDRIVANLLDLGRIEAGALRAEPDVFELDDLAGRTIDRMAARLEGRDLRNELAALPVLVDPVFLDEALTNLLDNAIKFSDPGAVGAGRRRSERGSGSGWSSRTAVAASPTTPLERVFEPFYRAPRPGRMAGPGPGSASPWFGASSRRWAARRGPSGDRSAGLPSSSTFRWRPCPRSWRHPREHGRDGPRRRGRGRDARRARPGARIARLPDPGGREWPGRARALGGGAPRRGAPRPGAAGHGRARGHPPDPARRDDADRDPVRPLRRAREGRGAGARRGRLRDQAVRARRAARAAARGAAPRGRPGRGRRRPRRGRAAGLRRDPPRGDGRRRGRRPHAPRVRAAAGPARASRAGW